MAKRTNPDPRRDIRPQLMEIYERLLSAFGPRGWWPGETAFEVMVGAVLAQNTAWKNVKKAIDNLKAAKALEPEALGRLSQEKLAGLVKPSGYFNLKAKRLKALNDLVLEAGGGDPPRLLNRPPDLLRRQLLAVNGVGPETADSILLYAANVPVFVIDAYTRRILARHHLIQGRETYDELQAVFMDNLPREAALYNEYHALLVALGHRHCKPNPRCQGCPLEGF